MNRKIIKNALIMATMVLFVPMAAAQVTIGSVTEPRATLDVVNITTAGHELPQGILPPQVTRAQLVLRAGNYDADVNGVIVYVIDEGLTGTPTGIVRNVTEPGHYYFNYYATGGPAWVRLGGGAATAPSVNIIRSVGGTGVNRPFLATELTADHTVILHYGDEWAGPNISLPNLPADRAGKIVSVVNRATDGTIQVSHTQFQMTTGQIGPGTLRGPILLGAGRMLMWVGDAWVELGA